MPPVITQNVNKQKTPNKPKIKKENQGLLTSVKSPSRMQPTNSGQKSSFYKRAPNY